MTAKYDFKTSPDIQGDKEQATLYPQLVVSGTKDLTDLAKEIARAHPHRLLRPDCSVTWKTLSPIIWQTVIT